MESMTPATPYNRRILVVDDMRAIHEDFERILISPPRAPRMDGLEAALFGLPQDGDRWLFELDSAYQGSEGLTLLEAALQEGRPYAVAFVDMRMPPGWSGLETIERLWQADPQLQVVLSTAYSDHPWEQVLKRLNVEDRL